MAEKEIVNVTSETLAKLDEIGANGLDWLQEFTRNGIQFIETQAPELCNEIIRWGIASSIFWSVVWLLLAAVCWGLWRKGKSIITKRYPGGPKHEEECMCSIALYMIPLAAMVGCLIGTCVGLYHAIYIVVAPRLYLLEYFADLASRFSGNGGT